MQKLAQTYNYIFAGILGLLSSVGGMFSPLKPLRFLMLGIEKR